jgi:hypothetical protein
LERLSYNEEYWDMHVAGNNNYVSEDGAIHHNSGKTEALIIRLVSLMQQDQGISVAHYFPSYKLAKRRGLSGVQAYLNRLGYRYSLNKSDLTITVHDLNDGVYYLDTYHDPDAIVSYEIAHGGVDELDTLDKDRAEKVWTKIAERMRQMTTHICGNTLAVASTTNQGVKGFCYEKWGSGENIAGGYHYIKAGTRSNKFLPAGYVDQIIKNYDPIMADAFVNGGWVSFNQNKVYHFFDRLKHHSPRVIQPRDWLHIGVDFNIGGCCAVVFTIENNKPTAVAEFVSHDTRDFCNNLAKYAGHQLTIYPDASGASNRTNASQSDIAIIRGEGYHVSVNSTNPAVRDRINAVNGLLAHDKLMVNTDTCPNFTNALEVQGYDVRGDPEKWNDHPAIDDWNDCGGYMLANKYPVGRGMLKTTIGGAL